MKMKFNAYNFLKEGIIKITDLVNGYRIVYNDT